MRRFKTPALKASYETCRRLSGDQSSELFWPDGKPHMTTTWHRAYWLGRNGDACPSQKGSSAYACWAAGVDDRRQFGPPPVPLPSGAPPPPVARQD